MKKLLPLAALIATPAYADGFKNREIAFQVLNAADAAQTCHIIGRGGSEANPIARAIIGKRPSCGSIIGFKVVSGLVHYVIADFARDRDPEAAKLFQTITLVIQGGAVAANMRFVF
jgi:16S rRNA C1402 N4-methylase RsmH